MQLVVSAAEMKAIDRETIERVGIPGTILMENAGLKSVLAMEDFFGDLSGQRIAIFCGRGNNGGDGLVVARHLRKRGADVRVYLLCRDEEVKGDAAINLTAARNSDVPIVNLTHWEPSQIETPVDIVVDALLGTGVKGEVTGILREAIEFINGQEAPVVAIDVPSGLNCDTGQFEGDCVWADMTVTMAAIKQGLLLFPGRERAGQIYVADITVPLEVEERLTTGKFAIEPGDIFAMLPRRPPDAYKNVFGKVFLVAGSTGLTGAACMASLTVLKSGAGMAILGVPRSLNPIFEQKLTEVMTAPLSETEAGSIAARAIEEIDSYVDWAHVLAIGPGLSTHPETRDFVVHFLQKVNKPIVVDADGLNNLVGHLELIRNYPSDIILTPHAGELSRLIQEDQREILRNRLEVVRKWAQDLGAVLVLKGAPSIIGDPDGNLFINTSGNAGMATAGSGDVLTGLIAGLRAQGMSALQAAVAGVYLHGLAGDLAREDIGERGMIAGDIMEYVPEALWMIENYPDMENEFSQKFTLFNII